MHTSRWITPDEAISRFAPNTQDAVETLDANGPSEPDYHSMLKSAILRGVPPARRIMGKPAFMVVVNPGVKFDPQSAELPVGWKRIAQSPSGGTAKFAGRRYYPDVKAHILVYRMICNDFS